MRRLIIGIIILVLVIVALLLWAKPEWQPSWMSFSSPTQTTTSVPAKKPVLRAKAPAKSERRAEEWPCSTDSTTDTWTTFSQMQVARSYDAAFSSNLRGHVFKCLAQAIHLSDQDAHEVAKRFMDVTEKSGTRVRVNNGTHIAAMAVWGQYDSIAVPRTLVVKFQRSQLVDPRAVMYAEEWTVRFDDTIIVLGRFFPCDCGMSAWGIVSLRTIVHVRPPSRIVVMIPPAGRCPQIQVSTQHDDTSLQFVQLTPNGLVPSSARCPFLFRMPGSERWYELPTQCPNGPCNFARTVASSGLSRGPSGGINVFGRPGVYTFQVSEEWANNPDVIYAFCLMIGGKEDSCAKDIRTADYTHGIAVVGYGGEAPVGWKGHERIWCRPSTVQFHCKFCPN